jgi:hypothetical protein
MAASRRWSDQADVKMAEMQALWETILTPKKSRSMAYRPPLSTPKRTTRSTLMPVIMDTPEGMERKAKAKEREERRALEAGHNRRRLLEHHRNLKTMKSRFAEELLVRALPLNQDSSVETALEVPENINITSREGDVSRKSYEHHTTQFQSMRKALRKSLNSSDRDFNIEFVLPKPIQDQNSDNDRAAPESQVLAQFSEQHDLRSVRRILHLEENFTDQER